MGVSTEYLEWVSTEFLVWGRERSTGIGLGWERSTMDGVSTEYMGWSEHEVPRMGVSTECLELG